MININYGDQRHAIEALVTTVVSIVTMRSPLSDPVTNHYNTGDNRIVPA